MRSCVATAAGAAAPPTSSGTLCRPLRYSQRRRKTEPKQGSVLLKGPALLRSSGDDSKAARLRQPLLSRHFLNPRCFLFSPSSETASRPTLARRDVVNSTTLNPTLCSYRLHSALNLCRVAQVIVMDRFELCIELINQGTCGRYVERDDFVVGEMIEMLDQCA